MIDTYKKYGVRPKVGDRQFASLRHVSVCYGRQQNCCSTWLCRNKDKSVNDWIALQEQVGQKFDYEVFYHPRWYEEPVS